MTAEVHVYGVVGVRDASAEPSGTRRIAHRDVAAVVADVEGKPLSASRALREHWAILNELASLTTVLPIRFGTAMAGDDAVVNEFLAPNHDGLRDALDALRGKVQLTVKGSYDQEVLLRGVVQRSPAIARLRAQVEQLPGAASYGKRIQLGELVSAEVEREREHDSASVTGRLEPLAVATRREAASGEDGAVNAAFLVERDQVPAFDEAVAELRREVSGRMQLRLIGPLPAYSFAPEGVSAWG
jgi:Gas vesicle synthesis protein GvpL/GvpF